MTPFKNTIGVLFLASFLAVGCDDSADRKPEPEPKPKVVEGKRSGSATTSISRSSAPNAGFSSLPRCAFARGRSSNS